ncbi:MAG: trehalose-phosphatase, partial [Gammaproteobacteria bacterium]
MPLLPSILDPQGDEALRRVLSAPALIAFDFDGTLAPIVERPDDARMEPSLDARVRELASLAPIAIVSGRGLDDLRKRAGIGARYLVGNHGNDGLEEDQEDAARARAVCREWRRVLEQAPGGPSSDPGIEIEDKGATLSIHYRRARDPAAAAETLPGLIASLSPKPRVIGGKLLFNLLPPGAVTKFEALVRLAGQAGTPPFLVVTSSAPDHVRQTHLDWTFATTGIEDAVTENDLTVCSVLSGNRNF